LVDYTNSFPRDFKDKERTISNLKIIVKSLLILGFSILLVEIEHFSGRTFIIFLVIINFEDIYIRYKPHL